MIRAILVDDELPAIERLKKLLKLHPEIDVVGECNDGLSALSLISEKRPDVVFLDIDMPELSGLEVAQTLGSDGPLIIFATAYDEYALAAFESNAVDYLVKPINPERLDFTIGKVRKSLTKSAKGNLEALFSQLPAKETASRLAVKIGSKYEVFDCNAISVAVAKDHYTALMVDGRELLSDDSLDFIAKRLNSNQFIRVHRGALLNIQFLKELRREGDRKYTAVLNDKSRSEIPVSRERLPQLKSLLGLD